MLEEGVQLEVPDVELKFWLYNNRGVAALILKDFVAAIFHLSVANSLKGSAWNPLLVRCEAYEAVGDYPAAAKVTLGVASTWSPLYIYIACTA